MVLTFKQVEVDRKQKTVWVYEGSCFRPCIGIDNLIADNSVVDVNMCSVLGPKVQPHL